MSRILRCLAILFDSASPADPVRSALEGKEEFWFICLLVASAGVAIGCVLEIPEAWADLKKWRRLRKESNSSPSWRVPIGAIGLLLVVLGVIGEGIFEALVSINETALRAHDERALVKTIKEAGDAKKSALDANDAEGQLEIKAKLLSDRLDDESSTLVGIETATTFRGDLLFTKKDEFERTLRKFQGQRYVFSVITPVWFSPEVAGLQHSLQILLSIDANSAGWKLIPPIDSRPQEFVWPGVVVAVNMKNEKSMEAGRALVKELQVAKIDAEILLDGPLYTDIKDVAKEVADERLFAVEPTSVVIMVGFNPMKIHKNKKANLKKP